jgi:GPH family glycoside/pentoside/hexuronide:cation symporter
MFRRKEKATPTPEDSGKLGRWNTFAYGLGGVPATMEEMMKSSYHMTFMTEFAGISPAVAGIINTVMTIWDAINDPLIGGMADRTNTRMGKYRPHMLWGLLSWTIITILMFCVPNFGSTGRVLYYAVLLFLWSVACTGFTVPWQSLNSVISTDVGERNSLLMYRMLIGTLSGTLLGIFLIPVVDAVDGGAKGYLVMATIVALSSLVCGLLCINSAKKRDAKDALPTPPQTSLKEIIKLIGKNRAVLTVALMLSGINMINVMNSAISIYYYKYVVGDLSLVSLSAIIGLLASLVILPIIPKFYKIMGRQMIFIVGTVLIAFTPVTLLILRENLSNGMILLSGFLFTIGFALVNTTTVSFVPDCVDYTELHFGSINAGLINAVTSFIKKATASLSTLIIGFALTLGGYVDANTVASPQLINSIINVRSFTVLLLLALSLLGLKLFPVTKAYGEEMRKKLAERRGQNSEV